VHQDRRQLRQRDPAAGQAVTDLAAVHRQRRRPEVGQPEPVLDRVQQPATDHRRVGARRAGI